LVRARSIFAGSRRRTSRTGLADDSTHSDCFGADALRQRGTSLRTTGGYEILIDAATEKSLAADADDAKLYLLRGHNARSAGEANLRRDGDGRSQVRIAFHAAPTSSPKQRSRLPERFAGNEILADVLSMLTAGTQRSTFCPMITDEPHVQVERP
jgi:hypothetical protein